MELFRNRPLFVWCTVFLAVSAGGVCLWAERSVTDALFWSLAGAAAAVGMMACGWLLRLHKKRQAIAALFAGLFAVGALAQSYGTFVGGESARFRAIEYTEVTVTGVVTDRRGAGGYLSSFSLAAESVDGVPGEGRLVLTCHFTADLSPGQVIAVQATVIPLGEAAGDGYDAMALRGDGYVAGLLCESEGGITVLREDAKSPQVAIGRLRRTLAARLDLLAGGTHGLPSALLLGDRSTLSDTVRRDFARAGASHLLAISGLHVTLLFGLLEGFLRLVRVPGRARAWMLGALSLGYLTLIGFPPSATRAVVMLGAVYLSTLLSARADALTSLGLAGALIVAITPHAAADAGFWMSYLATFGLLTLAPLLQKPLSGGFPQTPRRRWLTLLGRLGFGLGVGVIAMSLTVSVTAAVMGEMGILSPVVTLLLTPLCGVTLVTSLLSLCLFGTAAGDAVGALTDAVCEGMVAITRWMAEPTWAVVSLRHPLILPVAVLTLVAVVVLLALRLSRRRRWMVFLPVLVGWAVIGGMIVAETVYTAEHPETSYIQPSSQADALVMAAGHEGFICDLSNGSLTAISGAVREAERLGATEISVLMLTHYHTRTAGALGDVFARDRVRALWVPMPTDAEEYHLLTAYREKAEMAGVPLVIYEPGDALTVFGDGALTLWTSSLKRSVQPVLLVSLDLCPTADGGKTVYCGSAVFESALGDTAAAEVAEADTVIFGNHGPLPKAAFGAHLAFRDGVTVVLSGKGDVAGYFDPSALPEDASMWWGQKRLGRGSRGS